MTRLPPAARRMPHRAPAQLLDAAQSGLRGRGYRHAAMDESLIAPGCPEAGSHQHSLGEGWALPRSLDQRCDTLRRLVPGAQTRRRQPRSGDGDRCGHYEFVSVKTRPSGWFQIDLTGVPQVRTRRQCQLACAEMIADVISRGHRNRRRARHAARHRVGRDGPDTTARTGSGQRHPSAATTPPRSSGRWPGAVWVGSPWSPGKGSTPRRVGTEPKPTERWIGRRSPSRSVERRPRDLDQNRRQRGGCPQRPCRQPSARGGVSNSTDSKGQVFVPGHAWGGC